MGAAIPTRMLVPGNISAAVVLADLPNNPRYTELVELAKTCLFQAKITMAKDVAAEFRRMAREYQRRAADLDGGKLPDISEG